MLFFRGFWFINTTLVNLTFASGSESAGKGGEYKLLHNQSLAGADIGFGYSCGQQIFLSEKRSDAKEGQSLSSNTVVIDQN